MTNKLRNPYQEETEEFTVTFHPIKAGVYNIYLYGEIICASQFTSAIEVMNAATEQDMVVIHLSTNGGSISATDTLIAAMRECEAHIVVKATGDVHSAGSIILLAADEFSLSENFSCLIHNGSTFSGGKFSDYKAESQHHIKYMERVIRNSYSGFLSPEEIEDVIRGIDVWLDAEEFVERHEKRNAYLQALYEQQEEQGEHQCCGSCQGSCGKSLEEAYNDPPGIVCGYDFDEAIAQAQEGAITPAVNPLNTVVHHKPLTRKE